MRTNLTDRIVDDLQLEAGQLDQWFFDASQDGLAIRLRAGADGVSKTWYHRYMLAGQRRKDRLGSLGDLKLADARALVYRARRDMVEDVIDPRAKRQAALTKTKNEIATPTFANAVAEFLDHYKPTVRPASFRNVEGWLTGPRMALGTGSTYCEPLKTKRLDLISNRTIADLIVGLEKTRSRQVSQAVRAALQSFFKWAISRAYVSDNPVKGVRCPAPPRHSKRKKRPLSMAEIVTVWNGLGGGDYGVITKLTILLGIRRQEIGGMRWSELNLDAGTWTIPGERTKTHQPYVTPLSSVAVALIRSIERKGERDHVFGSSSVDGFTQFSKGKRELQAVAAIEPWRFHDLRSTIVTRMGTDLRIAPHVRCTVLNHANERNVTNAFYDDTDYAPEKREALQRWADWVIAHVDGKVVPLHKAA